jgi:hypothetical protein
LVVVVEEVVVVAEVEVVVVGVEVEAPIQEAPIQHHKRRLTPFSTLSLPLVHKTPLA